MRVRVKICGLTRPEDARAAARAGADAIGLVFHPRSPRAVDADSARAIAAAAGPFVSRVALFVDPEAQRVRDVVAALRPDLLQFHGAEDEAFCEQFGVPYLKAVGIGPGGLAGGIADVHPRAAGLLLDTLDPQRHGGTGRRFDWSLVPHGTGRPLVVAGGLDAACVGEAIATLRPWAVDVSSGVESAPGLKDARRIREFMRAVTRANAALGGLHGDDDDELA